MQLVNSGYLNTFNYIQKDLTYVFLFGIIGIIGFTFVSNRKWAEWVQELRVKHTKSIKNFFLSVDITIILRLFGVFHVLKPCFWNFIKKIFLITQILKWFTAYNYLYWKNQLNVCKKLYWVIYNYSYWSYLFYEGNVIHQPKLMFKKNIGSGLALWCSDTTQFRQRN